MPDGAENDNLKKIRIYFELVLGFETYLCKDLRNEFLRTKAGLTVSCGSILDDLIQLNYRSTLNHLKHSQSLKDNKINEHRV